MQSAVLENIQDKAPEQHEGQSRVVLAIRGLTKIYGNHVALDNIHMDIESGKVHVLFGENGAGKSTFISMLAGANPPSKGELEIGGHRGVFQSVAASRAEGIRAVFQEFSLIPQLTVAENIVLGEEPLDSIGLLARRTAVESAKELIHTLGFDLDPYAYVATLPRGKQQMVEICKALRKKPKILILDEPTASLSEHDARSLFDLVLKLKKQGTAIIYITHRMHEIPLLGDVVTVLRDGKQIATVPATTPEPELIRLMTGRTLDAIYPSLNTEVGKIRLKISNLSLAHELGVPNIENVSLDVKAGEIVGIAGLVGCGKSELGQACFGLKKITGGDIVLDDHKTNFRHPADAIEAGLWYSPADRKQEGLVMCRPAKENMSLSGLIWGKIAGKVLKPQQEINLLKDLSDKVEFAKERLGEPISNFSGGNQQKVMLAKGLAQDISVFVFDEPTVGVDMGARPSIYRYLADLSKEGAAILLISSDLPELFGLCHRILVMNNGEITAEFQRDEFDEHRILENFF